MVDAPKTWVDDELVDADELNRELRDQLRATAPHTRQAEDDLFLGGAAAGTLKRLAKGAANRVLALGAGGAAVWSQVTTAMIADGAVTGSKLANRAVTGPKIADRAVAGPQLDLSLSAEVTPGTNWTDLVANVEEDDVLVVTAVGNTAVLSCVVRFGDVPSAGLNVSGSANFRIRSNGTALQCQEHESGTQSFRAMKLS